MPRAVLLAVSLRRAHRARQCASVPASLALAAGAAALALGHAAVASARAAEGAVVAALQFPGRPGPYAESVYAPTTPAAWLNWAGASLCAAVVGPPVEGAPPGVRGSGRVAGGTMLMLGGLRFVTTRSAKDSCAGLPGE